MGNRKDSLFLNMVKFVNSNVGKVVKSKDILLGNEAGRNSGTSYLYTFSKLGYIEPVNGGFISDKDCEFKILMAFPEGFTSVDMKDAARVASGYVANEHTRKKMWL